MEAETKAEIAAVEAEALAEEHAVLEEKSDEELLAELNLPDPDTMTEGDDFSAFMSKAVPDRLRRRALRTLWRSNPVLANVDMLVDYGEDFTDAATVIENLQTAYQVGKGMLKHVEEMARQAEEAENPTPKVEEISDEEEGILMAEDVPEALNDETSELSGETLDEDGDQEELAMTATPRRMKFRPEEISA